MKLYAPSYYKHFKCIADKCKNSCCVDWEIDIDDASYEKYLAIGKPLTDSITEREGVRCFAFAENGRCPHLNSDGLCSLIINYGEEYLADICREHPRFYHSIGERAEVGIGLVCEEAARLIITSKDAHFLEESGNVSSDYEKSEYVTLAMRDEAIDTAISAEGDLEAKIKLLEQKYSLNPDIHSLEDWLDILLTLEILDEEWKKLVSAAKQARRSDSAEKFDREFENLLTYFLFRHVSLSDSYCNLRARIAFSILSVRIIKYLFERSERCDLDTLISLARLYSSEIEYSEDNTAELIFELESVMI